MSKRNNEEKIRLAITNWDGVVPIAISKGHDKMSRKVLTRGVLTSHDLGTLHRAYVESVLGTIVDLLRSGFEYRMLDEDGNEALRLFPCVEKDMKTVFVAAQTMGEFRKELNDKEVAPFVKGCLASQSEAREMLDAANKTRKGGYVAVTPDMMATCPRCSFEFRVGKKLG